MYIETERLILRKVKLSDFEKLYENVFSDAETVNFFPYDVHKNSNETLEHISCWGNDSFWVILLKETKEIIGEIAVENIDAVHGNNCCDIEYKLGSRFWNHGYATEAVSKIVYFLFYVADFDMVSAQVHVDNFRSANVCKKVGMKVMFDIYNGSQRGPQTKEISFYCIAKK